MAGYFPAKDRNATLDTSRSGSRDLIDLMVRRDIFCGFQKALSGLLSWIPGAVVSFMSRREIDYPGGLI